MKIYTKTGDDGETGLFGGRRVPKDNARVAAYGDVDELNAAIGFAASLEPVGLELELFNIVQGQLLTIGAELATPDKAKLTGVLRGEPTSAADISTLERVIDGWDDRLEPLKEFILPGGSAKAAALHLARTVCRRAERSVVTLARSAAVSVHIIAYLNRLSDLLFVLARAANHQAGHPDHKW